MHYRYVQNVSKVFAHSDNVDHPRCKCDYLVCIDLAKLLSNHN